jgi:stage II sporulation protein M
MIALGAIAGIFRESAAGQAIGGEAERNLQRMEKEARGVSYGLELAGHVILNNSIAAIEIVGLGLIFGIFPAFAIFINGLVLGYFPFYLAGKYADFSALKFLSVILPHGLIELPAILIAITCGLRLGIASVRALTQKDRLAPLRAAGRDVANMLPIAFMLLLLAGFVEGFISPLVGAGVEYIKIAFALSLFALMLRWFSRKPRRGGL